MTEAYETFKVKDQTVQIFQDDNPDSPRNWDNVGTMACWHRRYNLGDERPLEDPDEYRWNLLDVHQQAAIEAWEDAEKEKDAPDWYTIEAEKQERVTAALEETTLMLPLYLYDHSDITMSTSEFSCGWDSGQVGFIHAPKGFENMSDEQILKCMEGEVQVYDQYLTGDVWGYMIEPGGNSCWGFFGIDECRATAKEAAEGAAAVAKHRRQDRLKTLIRAGVPFGLREQELTAG